MADNVTANAGSGGATFATASGTWSGDTANFPGCFSVIISGSEGSWTISQIVGGAGAVSAGVQRVTLASDDPAVTALQTLDNAISGSEMQVDVVGALPAGTNNIGDVDVLSVPSDPFGANADAASATGSISAKLRFIAATGIPITGSVAVTNAGLTELAAAIDTEVQCDIVGALPAGDNNIGNVDLASAIPAGTNNIGDVDVLTVPSDPFGANADAASATGSISAKLRFIASTGIPITGTVAVGSHAVTNAGTFAVQVDGNALTALQLIDNVVYVDDADWTATTSSHTLIGGVYQSTPGTITDGDTGPFRVNENGALHVAIVSGAGSGGTAADDDADFTAGTTSGTPAMGVYESTPTSVTDGDLGTVGITQGRRLKTSATIDAALPAGTNAIGKLAANSGVDIGDVDVTSVGGNVTVVQGTASNLNATVVGTGTFSVQVSSLPASTNTIEVVGDAAHDAPVAGNPLLCGAYASAAAPSDVSGDGDAVRVWALRSGAVAIQPTYAGVIAVAGNGASGTGVQRVTIANDSTGVLATVSTVTTVSTLTNITNWGNIVDDAAFTPGTTRVLMAGFEADESATDSVDEGDGGAARMTLDRKIIVNPQPHTAGGLSIFRTLDLDETEEDVKTAAGQVYGFVAINTTNALLYLKFYNATAANTTVGSTTPVMTIPIPGNNDTDGAGVQMTFAYGIEFATAICVAATTGVADADTGAPGANALVVQVFFK